MAARPACVVIGSNCFTGSHITEGLLNTGRYDVVGVSRSSEAAPFYLPYHALPRDRFRFARLDLVRQFEALKRLLDETAPTVVINVAAYSEVALSHERPVEYFETNTLGTVRLCDFLRTRDWLEQYVHISSAEVYGSCPHAVTESHAFRPSTPYAASKAAADMYLDTLQRHFDFPATLVRSTNVYGRHQQLYKIIPRAAIYLLLGRTIELHGGGASIKSFVHIRDVVRGILVALERKRLGTFHFSVPAERTIADVVRLVCDEMGRDFKTATRVVGERLGQDSRYWLDCTRAAEELGWQPEVEFRSGVRDVIDWVQTNWEAIQREPLHYVHKAA